MKAVTKSLVVTSIGLASVIAGSLFVTACKEEEDETPTLTDAQKADAVNATAISVAKFSPSDSSSLRSPETIRQIRALYAQARQVKNASFVADEADFDVCSFFATSCEQQLAAGEIVDEDGVKCTTTSCTGGTTSSCTTPADTAVCKDVTYTFGESTSKTLITCAKSGDDYTLGIDLDFAGTISGGSFTKASELKCSVNLSMALSFSTSTDDTEETSEEDEIALSCEAGQFSCTVDGVALSCEDMKKAMEENTCS